jgi:hypothetical protein
VTGLCDVATKTTLYHSQCLTHMYSPGLEKQPALSLHHWKRQVPTTDPVRLTRSDTCRITSTGQGGAIAHFSTTPFRLSRHKIWQRGSNNARLRREPPIFDD